MKTFFKWIVKVFNDATKGRSAHYSYERIGTVLSVTWVILIVTTILIIYVIRTPIIDLNQVGEFLLTSGKAIVCIAGVFGGAIALRRFSTRKALNELK